MKRKIVALCMIAVLLSVAVMGTYAYFTDQTESVTNTFSAGDVSIEMTEPHWENPEYIQPGMSYAKDPTITNKGTNPAWIRMDVQLSDWTAFTALSEKYPEKMADLTSMFKGLDSTNWTLDHATTDLNSDTITYTYIYNTMLEKDNAATLFTSVEIPACLSSLDFQNLGGEFTVTVTGYAVQTDGFESAKAAFDTVTDFD